jgi:large subunit ribosomal protein L25
MSLFSNLLVTQFGEGEKKFTVIDGKVRLKMSKDKQTVFSLSAQKRDKFGKGASRRDRQANRLPAVVYGNGQDPIHVSLDQHDASLALRVPYATINLDLDGKKFVVAPRQIQKDPIKPIYKHVDLVVLNDKEQKERLDLAAKADEVAAEALKARLELAAKSKMDLGETAPAAAATTEGAAAPAATTEAAAPAATTEGAAAPAAEAKEPEAKK